MRGHFLNGFSVLSIAFHLGVGAVIWVHDGQKTSGAPARTLQIEFLAPAPASLSGRPVAARQTSPRRAPNTRRLTQANSKLEPVLHQDLARTPAFEDQGSEDQGSIDDWRGADFFLARPEYPSRCREGRIEGTTEVQIVFGSDGKSRSVSLLKAVRDCPEFGEVTLRVARAAQVVAHFAEGETRSAIIPFRFQLKN